MMEVLNYDIPIKAEPLEGLSCNKLDDGFLTVCIITCHGCPHAA